MSDGEVEVASVPPAPAIALLIERAATSFELDRAAAREYLFRACALIRAQKRPKVAQERPHSHGGLIAWQVKRVIAYVDAHLNASIRGKDLADQLNLSMSHFYRSFKVSVGMTPCEYIIRRRVDAAQQLMRTTSESLCQIAGDCGLSDQSHFCRVFRRVVGQTPNAWRRAQALEPKPDDSAPQAASRERSSRRQQ